MPALTLSLAGLQLALKTEAHVVPEAVYAPFLCKGGQAPDLTVAYGSADLPRTRVAQPAPRRWEVRYPPKDARDFADLRACLEVLPMEQILLEQNRFFLHASLVQTAYGGLVFTGDSGVGKSTQADLWVRHRGAELLNGDRVIVQRTEGGFLGWGSLYAGSSQCYVNRCVPIRAIFLLHQAPENTLVPADPGDAMKALLFQIALVQTTPALLHRQLNLAEELLRCVPVYHLYCTPDEGAVKVVEGAALCSPTANTAAQTSCPAPVGKAHIHLM